MRVSALLGSDLDGQKEIYSKDEQNLSAENLQKSKQTIETHCAASQKKKKKLGPENAENAEVVYSHQTKNEVRMYKKSQFPRWCVHLGGNEICLTLRGGRWRLAGRLDSLLKILHCVVGRLFECKRRCCSVIHCEKPHAHLLLSSQNACTVRIRGLDSIFLCPRFCFNFDASSQVQGCMLAGKREKIRNHENPKLPATANHLMFLGLVDLVEHWRLTAVRRSEGEGRTGHPRSGGGGRRRRGTGGRGCPRGPRCPQGRTPVYHSGPRHTAPSALW